MSVNAFCFPDEPLGQLSWRIVQRLALLKSNITGYFTLLTFCFSLCLSCVVCVYWPVPVRPILTWILKPV